MSSELMVLGGTANPTLTAAICRCLEIEQGKMKVQRFADGEIYPQIIDNVRGFDVFVVQPTCVPVNDNLMELMLIVDALRRASAKRITAVLPYYGYSRQDRKDKPRVPISAKVVATMLEAARVKRILSMDLHSNPIGGFFDIPVDNLYALPVMIEYFRNLALPKLTIVSPDVGGVERARLMAGKLNAPLAIIDKRRIEANVAEIMNVVGDVKDRDCLMVDDLIDTAGTLCKGAAALMDHGAASVRACATHGLFSAKDGSSAESKLEDSPLIEVIVTDTIPPAIVRIVQPDRIMPKSTKIHYLSVAPLFAQAIRSVHDQTSVSKLFI